MAPKKKEETAEVTETPAAQKKREAKQSRWTAEMCKKYAKRFDNEQAWAHGAPSSYKAAVARGFLADCTAHMSKSAPVKTKAPAAKKDAAPQKKVAAKKGGGRAA